MSVYRSYFTNAGLLDNTFEFHDSIHRILVPEYKPSKNLVVICNDDMVCFYDDATLELLPFNRRRISTEDLLKNTFTKFRNTQFVLFHNVVNLNINCTNCLQVQLGNNWTNKNLLHYRPVNNKLFGENYHWITLNNNKRLHRTLSCMYLLGKHFDGTGYIKVDPSDIEHEPSWNDYLDYWRINERNEIFTVSEKHGIFEKGFTKLKKGNGYIANTFRTRAESSNADNFNNELCLWYKHTAVELVNEVQWCPNTSGIISEKYFNTVFGRNIPILISTQNSLQMIRQSGYDVFDDVLDNGYDTIEDPFLRMTSAIDNNSLLFTDQDYAKQVWLELQPRMQKNIEQVRINENKTQEELTQIFKSTIESFK